MAGKKCNFSSEVLQPYRLNHLHALRVNSPDFHGLNLVFYSKWKIQNSTVKKSHYPTIFNSIFLFHSHENLAQIMG